MLDPKIIDKLGKLQVSYIILLMDTKLREDKMDSLVVKLKLKNGWCK